jgi:hypothetical protein
VNLQKEKTRQEAARIRQRRIEPATFPHKKTRHVWHDGLL